MEGDSVWELHDSARLEDYITSVQLNLLTRGIYVKPDIEEWSRLRKSGCRVFTSYMLDQNFSEDETLSRYFTQGQTASLTTTKSHGIFVSYPSFYFCPVDLIEDIDEPMEPWQQPQKAADAQRLKAFTRRLLTETPLLRHCDIDNLEDYSLNGDPSSYMGTCIQMKRKWTTGLRDTGFDELVEIVHRFYESIKSELI